MGASKMLQGRPCLWSTFEVESSLAFGALKWGPIVSQPATTCWANCILWFLLVGCVIIIVIIIIIIIIITIIIIIIIINIIGCVFAISVVGG